MAISEFFVRYLLRRDSLSPADLGRLRQISTTQAHFLPGDIIVPHSERLTRSCMMLRGMCARAHHVPGGEGRVITALHIAGDFVDLHGFVMQRLEHDVVSMGASSVEFIEHDELREITENYPHLARLLWLSTAIDAAMHRQWLVVASSRRASAHLAHLICELYTRLCSVGAAEQFTFVLPVLQRQLAEILGYSPIHVNRAVRDLRDRRLVRWSGAKIEILDWEELQRLARFSAEYLDLDRFSR